MRWEAEAPRSIGPRPIWDHPAIKGMLCGAYTQGQLGKALTTAFTLSVTYNWEPLILQLR